MDFSRRGLGGGGGGGSPILAGYTRSRTKAFWPPGLPLPPLTRSIPRQSRNQPWRDSAVHSITPFLTHIEEPPGITPRPRGTSLGLYLHIPPTWVAVEMIAVLLEAPSSRKLEIRHTLLLPDDSWTPRGICRLWVPDLSFHTTRSSGRF